MLFVTHRKCVPENLKSVVARFKPTGGTPPKGVKMIGRWHDVTQGRGDCAVVLCVVGSVVVRDVPGSR
jgi:hypothetical protein